MLNRSFKYGIGSFVPVLALAAGFFVGCAAEEEGDDETAMLECSADPSVDSERYDLAVLNQELSELGAASSRLSFGSVATCSQARQLRALQDELESTAVPAPADAPDPELQRQLYLEMEGLQEPDRDALSAEEIEKIYLGSTTTDSYSAWLPSRGCSAFFVSSKTLITAAHCVPSNSDTLSLTGRQYNNFELRYHWSGNVVDTTANVRIWRHANYSGSGDDNDDIAVIRLLNKSIALSVRIANVDPYLGQSLFAHGWGVRTSGASDAGILRRHPFWNQEVTETGVRRFRSDSVANTRLCSGDSGTAIRVVAGGEIAAMGIQSWAQRPSSQPTGSFCPTDGGKMGHTWIKPHIQWIRDRISTEGGNCSNFGDYYLCS